MDFFKDWQSLIEDFETFTKSEDNPFFKSKYVPLKVILPIVKEKCHKHNFIFFQAPGFVDGKSVLHTTIRHASGTEIVGSVELVHKPEDPQKLGASITYMRRYSLTCMFGLEEDDDDGNTASERKAPMMGSATGAKISKLVKILNVDLDELEKDVGKVTELTIRNANQLIKNLEAKLTDEQKKQITDAPF